MAASTDHPPTAAERLIAKAIGGTWLFWAAGALYIVGPALGWMLAAMALWQLYLRGGKLPVPVVLWMAGMLGMLVVLWVGHANFGLGTGQTIKSSIGWAKGWALLALFVFSGAVLKVREEVVARAVCKLGIQTLLLLPVFLIAPVIGLPEKLYTSPLQAVGGPGPEYFTTILYTIDPESGGPRWQFFAPWSPAAGMVAVIHALAAAREKHLGWRTVGLVAALLVAVLTASRLALVALVAIPFLVLFFARIRLSGTWFVAAPVILLIGLTGPTVVALVQQAQAEFAGARAGSSRVRAALGRIAVERWQHEAYWFGHGMVERGPHLVEYMPIGSHHSWYGLLFVKGLMGVVALAIPLGVSIVVLAVRAYRSGIQRVALAMVLVLLFYSFGENLEILAYLFWPGLLLMGAALAHSGNAEEKETAA